LCKGQYRERVASYAQVPQQIGVLLKHT
jgi:hypothetical protein